MELGAFVTSRVSTPNEILKEYEIRADPLQSYRRRADQRPEPCAKMRTAGCGSGCRARRIIQATTTAHYRVGAGSCWRAGRTVACVQPRVSHEIKNRIGAVWAPAICWPK